MCFSTFVKVIYYLFSWRVCIEVGKNGLDGCYKCLEWFVVLFKRFVCGVVLVGLVLNVFGVLGVSTALGWGLLDS